MRKSNWKAKALVVIAFIIGIFGGLGVMLTLPEEYAAFRGMAFFGTLAVVSCTIVFVALMMFHIGEE